MFESYGIDPKFNVEVMVQQASIDAETLRAWETQYDVFSAPVGGAGGRLYSARDIVNTRWLKAQTDAGMALRDAVALLRSLAGDHADAASLTPHQRLIAGIVAATGIFDEPSIERALDEAFATLRIDDVCVNLLQPLLITVGELWHSGEFTVNHEHFVTNLVQRKLFTLLAAAPSSDHGLKFVCFCAPGELHEVGLLMMSVLLRHAGHMVIYLGQDSPPSRMGEVIRHVRPDAVLISASHLISAASLWEALAQLHSELTPGRGAALVYGGRIFNHAPAIRQHMPGIWAGPAARDPVRQLIQIIFSKEEPQARQQPAPRPIQDALAELRSRKLDVIAMSARLITTTDFHFNTIAPKHERAILASEWLCKTLEAAVCLNEPSLLASASNWEWDSHSPHGFWNGQLHICVTRFVDAVHSTLSSDGFAALRPFVVELERAVKQR